jgi:hypothetical protein
VNCRRRSGETCGAGADSIFDILWACSVEHRGAPRAWPPDFCTLEIFGCRSSLVCNRFLLLGPNGPRSGLIAIRGQGRNTEDTLELRICPETKPALLDYCVLFSDVDQSNEV